MAHATAARAAFVCMRSIIRYQLAIRQPTQSSSRSNPSRLTAEMGRNLSRQVWVES